MVRASRGVLRASTRVEKKCVNGVDHVDRKQSKGASMVVVVRGPKNGSSQHHGYFRPWQLYPRQPRIVALRSV